VKWGALVLLAGCLGASLEDLEASDAGPTKAPAGAAGRTVAIAMAAGAPVQDAGNPTSIMVDAGAAADSAAPECVQASDCEEPLPALFCSAPQSLKEVLGWYCAGGDCLATSRNTWCNGGCAAGVCL